MTNYLDATGLHIEALTDIVTQLETDFRTIYGAGINLEPNSPDAQMINIFAQAKFDMLAVIADVFASMSPDSAIGSVLDQRCALNGIIRRAATYTLTNVTVTFDRDVELFDLNVTDTPFTVSDSTGNKFFLVQGGTFSAGSTILEFRAAESGAVLTTPNTITNIDTVTLGVVSVNNPSTATTVGIDEETDPQLRMRRRSSVSLASTGYLAGLVGALLNIEAVEGAVVYENVTGSIDGNGIPGHSLWAIVDGGADLDIANAIYQKRNAGCGMLGDETVTIESLVVKFDRPIYQNLYISMDLRSIDPLHTIDGEYIQQQIMAQTNYGIYQPADFSALIALVKGIDPLAVVESGGVSNVASAYISYKYPTSVQHRWILDLSRIDITVV